MLVSMHSTVDAWLIAADAARRTLTGGAVASRPAPHADGDPLDADQKQLSGALMRVNHVGEVCAQALYQAQALGATAPALRARFEQASYFGDRGPGVRVGRLVWPSGPQGIFIELQPFLSNPAENHPAQPAVADRQGFVPGSRGPPVPQTLTVLLSSAGIDRQGGSSHQGGGGFHKVAAVKLCHCIGPFSAWNDLVRS